ncbi:hypothetical protein BDV32DRAFT_15711 [Aspergillus pseudonomiae]|uniref:Uncharacterized protein n=1 Tax=Aspergillus pseudonomiae TaxID=1506151 RepID=A0A5N6HNZ2_9EURO|nr:uncharacterized protein BDV37DRAFT_108047 [Aspergillus pseudonomiae]KAB8254443.1 hypothetical protein BDV32DRAFT_15711 [Aspergillus pseudonomiae]KAE8404622.1 hypothetical protein BDV37DRAFT_108047 [Aspergillus pseudonomiae]
MTVNTDPPKSSVSERRGQTLAPLQTNFSRPSARPTVVATRPNRPRPEEYQNDGETGERVPLQTPVKRQSSKSGLRSIFSREKITHKESTDSKLSEIEEAQDLATQTAPDLAAPLSPALATPKTAFSTPTVMASPAADPPRSKPSKSRQKTSEDKSTAGEIGWKPPPLFQAYPQAIKHDNLSTPSLSAESILRIQATCSAKQSNTQNELSQADNPATRKKEAKEKKKHLRSLSETIGKTDWSPKIYVLVTAGYILQYAGSGKYDRLPEKMLQLGPKSVAFASDAIPGKHWVLQISQMNDENNAASTDTHRPLFSRFGFHRSNARRLTRSLLLVLNTPEEMSSWLLAVRAQIEARGGKKYVSEKAVDDDTDHQLESKPSIRQLVKKDPNRFSQAYLHPQPVIGVDDKDFSDQSRRSSYISFNRRSLVTQATPESRSESMSTTQTEVTSPVSGQTRFYSLGLKPEANGASSPPNGSAISTVLSTLDGPPRSPTFSSSMKRDSLHHSNVPTVAETSDLSQSQQTVPDPILRSASPPAPNFSVPSFSKRFTARMGQGQMQIPRFPSARNDETDTDETNTISAFPSPPQSPIKSITSVAMSESHEQVVPFRDSPKRRSLRISNSGDSLGDSRNTDPKLQHTSRISKAAAATSTAAQSSRPTSIIEHESAHSQIPQSPPETGYQASRREQQRHRVSVFPTATPNRSSTGPMLRRKSMPGLSVGPPALPPPDCPLPKIPSPVEPSLPEIAEQFPDPRVCTSPPPLKGTRLRRKSLASAAPRPAPMPLPPATQSLGSRHPRTVNGI